MHSRLPWRIRVGYYSYCEFEAHININVLIE